MSWLHHLATNDKEEDIVELLRSLKWSKSAAKIGASEFVKAANQIKEDKKEIPKFKNGKKKENG